MYGVDDALLIAGMAATAASAGMGVAANQEAQSKMSSVRAAETQRQSELQNEANQVFQKSLSTSGADTAKNKTTQGADQRTQIYNALKQVAQPTVGAPLAGDAQDSNPIVGADNPTRTANTVANARGGAWSNLTTTAAAKEGGYQDYDADQALKNAEANRNLSVIGNRARGWANVFPLEMNVASHAGDALSGWGQLVGALGSVAGIGGAMGVGTFKPPTMANMNAAGGAIVDVPDAAADPGAWSSIGRA